MVEWCCRRAIEALDRRVEWCGRRAMEAPFGIRKSDRRNVVVAVDFMILAKLRYCSLNKFWLVRIGMRKTKTNKIKEVS